VIGTRVSPLLVSLLALLPAAAPAKQECVKSCKQETRACEQTRCTGLPEPARRTCVQTCRGIGGCAHIRTFAYVVSKCTVHAFHQKLQIRHGNCDPITVLDFPEPVETPPPVCATIGMVRGAGSAPIFGAFQRLGVSPDGRHVVFEVKDDFTGLRNFTVLRRPLVPPGQSKGIFVVRADGRGLRRLGLASRDPAFRFAFDPAAPNSSRASLSTILSFSPDGREVVLTDLGPGPGGEEAVQLFTLDLVTGRRTQVTHLPVVADRLVGPLTLLPAIYAPIFLADGRIAFESFGNLDGSNPEGSWVEFVVNRDGSGLKGVPLPVALAGSRVVPIFGIEGGGARRRADVLSLPGTPVNPGAAGFRDTIVEIFFVDGKNFLQLTDFSRVDTESPTLTPDGQHVIFRASADPFGTNRSGTCQLFSISPRGTGLRQLTHFSQPEYSVTGCYAFSPPGCVILPYGGADPATGTLLFWATCDPFGTNPFGDQLFAIRVDGTHLRQLTHARGLATEPDGTVSTENIGPFAYSAIVSGQH
jgi:hypothetical protein